MVSRKRTKHCKRCDTTKPASAFSKGTCKDGLQSYCKSCSRDDKYIRRYGITGAEVDALLKRQDGRCAVCTTPVAKGRGAHVDHCHSGGHVRGIVCNHCNLMLGYARDNPSVLRAAALYLERDP